MSFRRCVVCVRARASVYAGGASVNGSGASIYGDTASVYGGCADARGGDRRARLEDDAPERCGIKENKARGWYRVYGGCVASHLICTPARPCTQRHWFAADANAPCEEEEERSGERGEVRARGRG
eukprot:822533-Rhodomonas_salina.1